MYVIYILLELTKNNSTDLSVGVQLQVPPTREAHTTRGRTSRSKETTDTRANCVPNE